MKNIIRLILVFIWIGVIGFMSSCRSTKVPEVVSTIRKDSTITIVEKVPVLVPGATVYKKLNIDSLRALFGSGKIERYYVNKETEGLNDLTTKIDLLTGQMSQECATRDSIIFAQNKTITQLKSERVVTKEPEKKQNWFNRTTNDMRQWINTLFALLFIAALGYIIYRVGKKFFLK